MIAFALSFAAGLLTALSPCVLPLLPIVVGSAATAGRMGPVALAGGLVTAFTTVGLLLASVQEAVGLDDVVLRRVSAAVLFLAGAVLVSTRLQDLANRAASPLAGLSTRMSTRLGDSVFAQFAIGAALGGVWSPCAGPTLGAAIGLATQADTLPRATAMMFMFGVGATIPLLSAGYASHALLASRGLLLRAASTGKTIFGGALLALAGFVWFGLDKTLEAVLLARLPDWWVDILAKI
jgi:cytochrome c-type biogenesis protein